MKIMKNNRKSRRKVLSIVLSSAMVVTMAAGFGPDTAKATTTPGVSTPSGTYSVDFEAETVAIPESAEYNTTSASESSPWENGGSAATTVTPGTTYYIHADSDTGKTAVETLVAPERPDAPATNVVTIAAGLDAKRTKLTFTEAAAGCSYKIQKDKPEKPTTAGDASLTVATTKEVTPAADAHVWMKKNAVASASFASDWTDCGAVVLGTTDLSKVKMDLAAGKLTGTVTDMQYSIQTGDTPSWQECTDTETTVSFAKDQNVIVRVKGESDEKKWVKFGKLTQEAKPAESTFDYDIHAGTITGLGNKYEYQLGGAGDWYTKATGVTFVAGTLKFRAKATATGIASESVTKATIGSAPAAPTTTLAVDYEHETTDVVLPNTCEYTVSSSTSAEANAEWTPATGAKVNLNPAASDTYIVYRTAATKTVLAGATKNVQVKARRSSNSAVVAGNTKVSGDATKTSVNIAADYDYYIGNDVEHATWKRGEGAATQVAAQKGNHIWLRLKATVSEFVGAPKDAGAVIVEVTDTEKVADAKAAAEEALAKFIATNNTTEQNVIDAIKTEIEKTYAASQLPNVAFTDPDGDPTTSFVKVDATKSKEGRVTGTIVISSGEATAEVVVDLSIDKLANSAADKVATAKAAADTAVKAMKASNTTTEAVVLAAVKAAVASDIEVSIANYKVTPATTVAAGKVEGTIKLAKGKYAKDELAFNIAIAKLVPAPAATKPAPKAPAKPVVKKSYTVGGYKYTVTKMGTKTGVVTCTGMTSKKATSVKVPATIKINTYTMNVEAISAKAFYKNTKIKSATIGDKVKTIGDKAFYGCKNLKKVTVGKAVTTVGKSSFGYAKKACVITFNGTKLKTVKSAINYKVSKMVVKAPKSKVKAYKKIMKKAKGLTVKAK